MRSPRLAHRSAAAHKLHSTPQRDRMNLISGKGETSSRLPAFSLFLPGTCPNNRDRRRRSTEQNKIPDNGRMGHTPFKAPLRRFRFLRKPSSNGFREDDYPATRSPKECLGKSTFRTRRSLSCEHKYDAQLFRRRRHHEVVGSPNTLGQSPTERLLVISPEPRSSPREITWK